MKKSVVAGVSGAVSALALALTLIGGRTVVVGGNYKVSEVTNLSREFVLTVPHERVPNATFYSLFFDEDEIGVTTFGENYGIVAGHLLFTPIDRLSVVVYDVNRNVIGTGQLGSGGNVGIKFNEKEVVSNEKAN